MLKEKIDLQIFAEGGDSGAAGEGAGVATGVENNGSEEQIKVPSFIPEKKRQLFIETAKKTRSASEAKETKANPQGPAAEDPTATKEKTRPSFAELAESENYKAEKDAYMHDAFKKRFAKYEGIEQENAAAKDLLNQLAQKYGVESDSKSFFEDLRMAMSNDNSNKRVEEYMKRYDADEEEAKRIVKMEMDLEERDRQEQAKQIAEKELRERAVREQTVSRWKANAEETKKKYPGFDFSAELNNEAFRRMLFATGGDTTFSYEAVHHKEILDSAVKQTAQNASVQITNAVAANKQRPSEAASGNPVSSVAEIDISKLSAAERRKRFDEMLKARK